MEVSSSVDLLAIAQDMQRNIIIDKFNGGHIDAMTAASELKKILKPTMIH
jgi:hypothetical protein